MEADDLFLGKGGLIMLNFKKSSELVNYHSQALELFNPLREGALREKYQDQKYFDSLSEDVQENISRYGHRWVLKHYQPHITLSRIEESFVAQKIIKKYKIFFEKRRAGVVGLRITQDQIEPVDKNVLIFDKKIV